MKSLQRGGRLVNRCGGVFIMLLEILRLSFAFGSCALIVAFWYWLFDSIGTF